LAERAVTPKENSSEAKATEKGGNREGGGEKRKKERRTGKAWTVLPVGPASHCTQD